MKIKIKGEYYTGAGEEQPTELTKITCDGKNIFLYQESEIVAEMSGYSLEEIEVEDGEFEKAPPTPEEQAQAAALLAAKALGLAPDIEVQAEAMQVIVEAAGLADATSPNGDWQPNEYVAVGDKRAYNGQSYICRLAHVTQADWAPDVAVALWEVEQAQGAAWVQPAGAHDAYAKGAVVTHDDKTWVSEVDANIWEPGVYGWEEVEG